MTESDRDRLPVSWFELFYDLVVVAGLVGINGSFLTDPDPRMAATATSATAALYVAWLLTTLVNNRFPDTDATRRVLMLCQMACVVVAALAVDQREGLRGVHGLIAFAVALLTVGAMIVHATRGARPMTRADRIATVAVSAGAVLAVVATAWSPQWLWAGLLAASEVAAVPIVIAWRDVGLEPRHLGERMGLLVLMVLGLGFGQLVVDLSGADTIPDVRFFVLMFVLMFVVWWLYFGLDLTEDSTWVGRPSWYLAHFLLVVGIAGIGDVMAALSASQSRGPLVDGAAYLGLTVAALLLGIAALVRAHDRLGRMGVGVLVGTAIAVVVYDAVADVTDAHDLRLAALISTVAVTVAALALATVRRRRDASDLETTSRNTRQVP